MAKVLVVDDDPGIVNLLQRIITKRGYQAFVARDGREGLELAKAEQPDLIFTDIKMPDLDGEELTSLLKADPNLSKVPIVILSGTAFLVDLEVTQANAILNKPFELKAVYALLEQFLPLPDTREAPLRADKNFKHAEPPLGMPTNLPASSL